MPKIKFTKFTLPLFLICWAMFWLLGGAAFPENALQIEQKEFSAYSNEAWLYCTCIYLFGSILFSFVEHKSGFLEPINLKFVYMLAGIGLMAGSIIWWMQIKSYYAF